MKKFFLLLILFLTIKGYGQSYSIEYGVLKSPYYTDTCWQFELEYYLTPDNITIVERKNESFTRILNSKLIIPNGSDLKLRIIKSECNQNWCDSNSAITEFSKTIGQVIKGDFEYVGLATNDICSFDDNNPYNKNPRRTYNFKINSFKPNGININSHKPTICEGEELKLTASTEIFPDEVYHWQYSFDNAKWIDVPQTNIKDKKLRGTISDIIQDKCYSKINNDIYFRIGYNPTSGGIGGQPGSGDRPFTTSTKIFYSSCIPLIKSIRNDGTKCFGDKFQKTTILFDREFYANETINSLSVINTSINDQIIFQQTNFKITGNSYSFDCDKLEPNEILKPNVYKMKYQPEVNGVLSLGFIKSCQTFIYNMPVALKFKITKQTPPSCFGGEDGSIEIMVTSGVDPYCFYLDGVELKDQLYPKLIDGKYHIFGLKANPEGYKIKVTDTNDCIEKATP
jgi:hypothetical protein